MKQFFLILLLFALPAIAFGAGQSGFITSPLWHWPNTFFVGDVVRLHAAVVNSFDKKLLGTVQFFDNEEHIGNADFALEAGGRSGTVWADWKVSSGGHHAISAKITNTRLSTPDGEEPITLDGAETSLIFNNIDYDTDGDRVGDTEDPDDDNDGLSDEEEQILGTDPRNADSDGDGVSDGEEIAAGSDPTTAKQQTETNKEKIQDSADNAEGAIVSVIQDQREVLETKRSTEKDKKAFWDGVRAVFDEISNKRPDGSPPLSAVLGEAVKGLFSLAVKYFLSMLLFLLQRKEFGIPVLIFFIILVVRWIIRRRRRHE